MSWDCRGLLFPRDCFCPVFPGYLVFNMVPQVRLELLLDIFRSGFCAGFLLVVASFPKIANVSERI